MLSISYTNALFLSVPEYPGYAVCHECLLSFVSCTFILLQFCPQSPGKQDGWACYKLQRCECAGRQFTSLHGVYIIGCVCLCIHACMCEYTYVCAFVLTTVDKYEEQKKQIEQLQQSRDQVISMHTLITHCSLELCTVYCLDVQRLHTVLTLLPLPTHL